MLVLQMQPGVKSARTIINNKQALNSHKENERERILSQRQPLKICHLSFYFSCSWNEQRRWACLERDSEVDKQKKYSVLKHRGWSSSPEANCFWFPSLPKTGLECLQRSLHHLLILLCVWWIGGVHHGQNLWDCKNKHNLCKNNSLWTNKTVSNPETLLRSVVSSLTENSLDNKKSCRILTIYYNNTVQQGLSHMKINSHSSALEISRLWEPTGGCLTGRPGFHLKLTAAPSDPLMTMSQTQILPWKAKSLIPC